MADTKISALTAATTLGDTDEMVLASAGASKKITGANLKASMPGAGGGASKKLFDQTLAVDALTIDTGAGGIAAGYGVLEVFIYGRTDEAGSQGTECYVRLNADAGANYDWQRISASATAVAASQASADAGWDAFVSGAGSAANAFGMIHLMIPAYDNTVGFKAGRWTDGFADPGGSGRIATKSGIWRNTAAISRLSVQAAFSGTVKLKAGSRMMIYGMG